MRGWLHDNLGFNIYGTLADDPAGAGWLLVLPETVESSAHVQAENQTASVPTGATYRRHRCRYSTLAVTHKF